VSLAALIAAQREQHGIPYAVACGALGVSQAWFYKWLRHEVARYEWLREGGRPMSET
jgi:hypothetical protein